MKIYIAAPFEKTEHVKEIHRMFMREGHQISADWTLHKPLKPYDQNPEMCMEYAIEDMDGVLNSDIFVVIATGNSTGHKIELGAAIASRLLRGKPKIYMVCKRESIFHFHPAINHRESIKEVLEEINRGEV